MLITLEYYMIQATYISSFTTFAFILVSFSKTLPGLEPTNAAVLIESSKFRVKGGTTEIKQ